MPSVEDVELVPIHTGTMLNLAPLRLPDDSWLTVAPIQVGTSLPSVSLTFGASIPRSVIYTGTARAKAGIRQVPKDDNGPVRYVGRSTGW